MLLPPPVQPMVRSQWPPAAPSLVLLEDDEDSDEVWADDGLGCNAEAVLQRREWRWR